MKRMKLAESLPLLYMCSRKGYQAAFNGEDHGPVRNDIGDN
jgi:hypothetical protein